MSPSSARVSSNSFLTFSYFSSAVSRSAEEETQAFVKLLQSSFLFIYLFFFQILLKNIFQFHSGATFTQNVHSPQATRWGCMHCTVEAHLPESPCCVLATSLLYLFHHKPFQTDKANMHGWEGKNTCVRLYSAAYLCPHTLTLTCAHTHTHLCTHARTHAHTLPYKHHLHLTFQAHTHKCTKMFQY